MKSIAILLVLLQFGFFTFAQQANYNTKQNLHYYSDALNQSNAYINERCVLDIYYPTDVKRFATIVWFHGGGLMEGNKYIPLALKEKGVCIVAVNYRLCPNVKVPDCLADAAASVNWVFKNIESYGGDASLIFVAGHSAGGYLTTMIGLDKSWLKAYDIDANRIAGLISFSGQAITHFAVREKRGIPKTQPVIDSLAPIFHVRADAPPLLLVTGDRELELLGRYEENAYFMRMMKVCGHTKTKLYELDGYDHGMTEPAFPLLLNGMRQIVGNKNKL